jgi:FHS family L-fucose permease-like MFS transporter
MKRNTLALILLTSLFFFWGLASNMTDTLLAAFKRIMSMTDFQTSLIQLSFYGAYFFLAFPAALFIRRYSYKAGVLLGLSFYIAGALLFYPASLTMQYGHFLIALFILAGGLSVLETAANPYILVIGPKETATRRLNLAQSFNPIGAVTGVLLSKLFILSGLDRADAARRSLMTPEQLHILQTSELKAVMGPYAGVAFVLIVIALIIRFTPLPKTSGAGSAFSIAASLKKLMSVPRYWKGVMALFAYMGIQIGVWSFTIRYVMAELAVAEDEAANYYILSLVLFTAGRFIATGIMKYFLPSKILGIAAIAGIVSLLTAIFTAGMTGVIALMMVSAFLSLMFPTIFGLAVDGLGEDTKIAGSGLVMAILGGAVFPVMQAAISDVTGSIKISLFLPALLFLVVFFYARYIWRKDTA